jgi:ATP-binding cassette subfamily B protein RaxB
MMSTPPFVAQERPDTCALACLRMLLAQRGMQVAEAELVEASALQQGGLTPEELCQLARHYGLQASEEQLDRAELHDVINKAGFPIVFLFRRPIDRVDMTHAVVAVRRSRHYVTVLDPLRGERRISLRKFEEARRWVGRWVVLCTH